MESVPKSSLKVRRILFDTCFIIECLAKAKSEMNKTLFDILQLGYVPIVTSTIVKELDKKRRKVTRNLDTKICSEWFQFLWSRLIVVDDSSTHIRSDSEVIPTHFPDNVHIAAAKSENAAIISLDKKLDKDSFGSGNPCLRTGSISSNSQRFGHPDACSSLRINQRILLRLRRRKVYIFGSFLTLQGRQGRNH